MAVEPLDWVTWREARDRMEEIWDGWGYRLAEADQAMVNSLRRGNVSFRGKAWGYREHSLTRHPLALRDVVAGLLSLRVYPSLFAAEAEYEATEWHSVPALGGGNQMRPMTVKKIAWLDNPELARDEFRDDLIRFELPAGVKPKGAPRQRTRKSAPSAAGARARTRPAVAEAGPTGNRGRKPGSGEIDDNPALRGMLGLLATTKSLSAWSAAGEFADGNDSIRRRLYKKFRLKWGTCPPPKKTWRDVERELNSK
jgi:hypothetical protein